MSMGIRSAATGGAIQSDGVDRITFDATGKPSLSTPLSVESGGTGNNGGAWTGIATTVAPTGGSFGSATGGVNYIKIGRTVHFTARVTVISNGSGSGAAQLTLPFSAAQSTSFAGREIQTLGHTIVGFVQAGSATVNLFKYDNTYPAANNTILIFSGTYEATA